MHSNTDRIIITTDNTKPSVAMCQNLPILFVMVTKNHSHFQTVKVLYHTTVLPASLFPKKSGFQRDFKKNIIFPTKKKRKRFFIQSFPFLPKNKPMYSKHILILSYIQTDPQKESLHKSSRFLSALHESVLPLFHGYWY